MKRLIDKVRNSEFLTMNELLQVKVTLVMVFLLMFGLLTIPVSFFEDLALSIRIIVPLTFISLFTITFIMLIFQKARIAMHLSIFTFIGLTVYYVDGSGQLYGYFLLFITITVIIFYQDITTYILYGGLVTAYGAYFVQTSEELIKDLPSEYAGISPIIYQFILIGFFALFLIQFILTDSINEDLNLQYLKTSKANKRYREYIRKYEHEMRERDNLKSIRNRNEFQNTIKQLAIFINNNLEEPIEDIEEVVEYYFFLHKQDVSKILNNERLPKETRTYAEQFQKYLLDKESEITTLIYSAYFETKQGVKNRLKRYEQNLASMFSNRTNRIIGLAVIYKILTNEVTQVDNWGRVNKILTHSEFKSLIQKQEFRDVITFEDMNFFLNNETLFKNKLS